MACGHVRDAKLFLEEDDRKHRQAVQVASLRLQSGGQSPSGPHRRMDVSERFADLQRDMQTSQETGPSGQMPALWDSSEFDS